MPDVPLVRREIERTLVRGSIDVVEPDNFRAVFSTLGMAMTYVTRDVGFAEQDTFLYAVLRVRYAQLLPTSNRRGWANLREQTRKDYLGSRQAQREAAAHDMTVPEWYEVAPDLKAFRRQARGRTGAEGATRRDEEFLLYIARKYKVTLSNEDALRISAGVREAYARAKGEDW